MVCFENYKKDNYVGKSVKDSIANLNITFLFATL